MRRHHDDEQPDCTIIAVFGNVFDAITRKSVGFERHSLNNIKSQEPAKRFVASQPQSSRHRWERHAKMANLPSPMRRPSTGLSHCYSNG